MRLKIRYRSSDDEVSERIISHIVVEPPRLLHAICHLRGEERSFAISRIELATNLDTGEVIHDVAEFFGLPSIKPQKLLHPVFDGKPFSMPIKEAQRQRKKDKADLYKRFRTPVIAELAKKKLYTLFRNRCFKCGDTSRLELDHHIPQFLGGRLVPGNLVILCSRCNAAKRDSHPEQFYAHAQLIALQPLLDAQLEIFNFQFDWTRWNGNRDQYLLSLGASPEFVNEVMTNELSPYFCGKSDDEREGIVITLLCSDTLLSMVERLEQED